MTTVADRDYYAALGVSRDATGEEIKRAYRKLARELHPDVNPDPVAQERFKEVTAIYEVLSDPERRRIVDLRGDTPPPGGRRGAGPSSTPPPLRSRGVVAAERVPRATRSPASAPSVTSSRRSSRDRAAG